MSQNGDRKVFSQNEKLLLIHLVESYKNIIESKQTDNAGLRKKQDTWDKICARYNSNDVTKRTRKRLKKLWDNIKQKTRKADSTMKYESLKTGGGPPPKSDDDPIHEMVRSVVPTIDLEIENCWDSVALFKSKRSEKEEKTEPEPVPSNTVAFDHTYGEITLPDETQNENISACKVTKKKSVRHKMSKKKTFIEEEAALRKTKLGEAIEQQRQLHKMKMDAAEAEQMFWKSKTDILKEHWDENV